VINADSNPDYNDCNVVEVSRNGELERWELRAAVSSSSYKRSSRRNGIRQTVDDWNGDMHARHGCNFPSWWKHHRFDHGWSKVFKNDMFGMASCDVCAYVKVHNETFDDLRDQFLDCIGGQSHVYCKCHDVPLILSYEEGAICCSAADCTRKTKLECPIETCQVGMCHSHYKNTSSESKIFLDQIINDINMEISEHSDTLNRDIGKESDNNSSDYNGNTGIDNDSAVQSGNGGDRSSKTDESDIISKASSDDHEDVDLFQDDIRCDGTIENDELDSVILEEVTGDVENFEIPTTNAGLPVMDISMKNDSYIPLHVVLNGCGSLLIRRQSKLVRTRRQQHFLHKIAATSPGQTIPLLYPKEM
jgi:hypothetical protein